MPIIPKLDLNLFIDPTDSDTLEENRVSVRGRRRGKGRGRGRDKEINDPCLNGIVYTYMYIPINS